MEYTVIGDTANLASRLDALCGESKGDILCDRRTVERSGLKDVTRIADRTIRGRKGEVVIYRV
jgi:class 3 adenylate cyclase